MFDWKGVILTVFILPCLTTHLSRGVVDQPQPDRVEATPLPHLHGHLPPVGWGGDDEVLPTPQDGDQDSVHAGVVLDVPGHGDGGEEEGLGRDSPVGEVAGGDRERAEEEQGEDGGGEDHDHDAKINLKLSKQVYVVFGKKTFTLLL